MSKITKLQLLLKKIIDFLDPYLPIANCHMVDFLTNDHWNTLVNEEIKNEFEKFGIEKFINCFENNETFLDSFKLFVHNTKNHTLDSLKEEFILDKNDVIKSYSGYLNDAVLDGLNGRLGAMTEKKIHEVKTMSGLIVGLSKTLNNSGIIDIGGGKGYLTSILALHHNLNVLSLDSALSNTMGAQKRFSRLEKSWNGIRNKIIHNSSKVQEVSEPNLKKNNYRHRTLYVTKDCDIIEIFKDEFKLNNSKKEIFLGLIGLHTCGDLSPTGLEIFTKGSNFNFLCTVGCCYHLLSEAIPGTNSKSGFPMSKFLIAKGYSFKRNARMLASQSLERNLKRDKLSLNSLLFRAILQVILLKKLGNAEEIGQVGRIGAKCQNFSQYVNKSIRKLSLNLEISEQEIDDYFNNYKKHIENIEAFFVIRSCIAPIIESIILLDRLLFLYEQGYQMSFLTKIFDSIVSPRCYAIVSIK